MVTCGCGCFVHSSCTSLRLYTQTHNGKRENFQSVRAGSAMIANENYGFSPMNQLLGMNRKPFS